VHSWTLTCLGRMILLLFLLRTHTGQQNKWGFFPYWQSLTRYNTITCKNSFSNHQDFSSPFWNYISAPNQHLKKAKHKYFLVALLPPLQRQHLHLNEHRPTQIANKENWQKMLLFIILRRTWFLVICSQTLCRITTKSAHRNWKENTGQNKQR
jgi:hypothetical protein